MRIALVIANYNAQGGGAERWTDRHARWLLSRGCQVHLVARGFRDPPAGAVCHRIDAGTAFMPGARLQFARAAERFLAGRCFDVVADMGDGWHADVFMPHHGTREGGYSSNTRLLPSALRWTRGLARQLLPRYREFGLLERRQYRALPGKMFVAVSEMVRQDMLRFWKLPTCQVRVIHNGVDTDRFRPAEPERRAQIRQELGIEVQTAFLLVAHNFRLKGLDCVLHALARLRGRAPSGATRQAPSFPERESQSISASAKHWNSPKSPEGSAILLVVGAGAVRKYRRRAEALGVAEMVRFAGDQPDPVPYFQAADIYVQPTFYDPCSLVVLEALAASLPVITSRMNGAAELITPGVHGRVLDDPRDSAALADFMTEFLEPQRRWPAARAARELALRNTFETNGQQFWELYQQIHAAHRAA